MWNAISCNIIQRNETNLFIEKKRHSEIQIFHSYESHSEIIFCISSNAETHSKFAVTVPIYTGDNSMWYGKG